MAALSGPVDRERLERGVAALEQLGFEVVAADNLDARHGPFAGSDGERLAAFHRLTADPSIRAVFFARGGHGVLRLLPRLEWRALAAQPRAYVGYSDLTPFLLQVVDRLGWVSFHGPMVAVELAEGLVPAERRSLLGALAGELPATVPVELLVGRSGAQGPLRGGCLSLLAATAGTPFAPRLEGSLLFWEDVAEPLYRVDRMLQQLRLAGAFEGLRGMVVGRLERAPEAEPGLDLAAVLGELAAAGGWPVATGCRAGHCRPNHTLPLGAEARLERRRLLVGLPPSSDEP